MYVKINGFLFGLLILASHPLYAQNILFSEYFDDAGLQAWTITDDPQPRSGPSDWRVINGELWQLSNIWSYDPPAEFIYHLGTHATAGEPNWTDYTLNAVLRSTDNDGIGLIVRYQDPGNYYRVLLMNDANNSGSARSPIQRIQRFVNGEPVTLHQNVVETAYPAGYFSLSVDVRADTIRAYLNGVLIGQAVDTTYASGKIGLLSYANAGSMYDDILVTSDQYIYDEPDRRIVYPVTHNRRPYIQQVDTRGAYISWHTLLEAVGRVEYGTQKDEYTASVMSSVAHQEHTIYLADLEPDTRYYYRVFNDDILFSDGYSFRTAPEQGSGDEIVFMVLGDSGTGNDNQRSVRDQMLRTFYSDHPRFLIHTGDVHQGNGAAYDAVYFDIYHELLQQIPFYLAIGNHDTYTDNAAPFLRDFVTPRNDHYQGRYYAHQWGDVYFINLDTNIPFAKGTEQYDFLERALTSEQRQTAVWTVLYFHHPPYSEYWPAWEGDPTVRRDLMPLFEQHGVDVVFNGHTHSYEYGYLNGVHYVVSGGGGGNLDPYGRNFDHVQFSDAVHHFGLVRVRGNRFMFQALNTKGNVVHSFRIEKTASSAYTDAMENAGEFRLHQNAPNPFNPTTYINFETPSTGTVNLQVFNVLGQPVATLVSSVLPAGSHRITFSAEGLSSGVYFYRLVTASGVIQRSMTVVK
ncbi:MAG: T9SS C-terminal target domain-containing protein [Balneolaceae bacterium]|nr:MAG: T9SS C-terminal target domain-containing protein [Balneolaceae bacterium]